MFRHKLIAMLIFFDFLKAVMILVFSAITYMTKRNIYHSATVTGLGWLTVFSIEGADVIIMSFAIHMELLVFNTTLKEIGKKILHFLHLDKYTAMLPSPRLRFFKQHNASSRHNEGGLYESRHTVIALSLLFPILLSSVSFCVPHTYQGFIYMPFFRVWSGPWWFSWVFRHVVSIGIMIIYFTIYITVWIQFWKVSKMLKRIPEFMLPGVEETMEGEEGNDKSRSSVDERTRRRRGRRCRREYDDESDRDDVFKKIFSSLIWYNFYEFVGEWIVLPIQQIVRRDSSWTRDEEEGASSNGDGSGDGYEDADAADQLDEKIKISREIQNLLYEETMEKFKVRKSQIMKQMRMIFIYPISFFLLWLFPIINHYQIIVRGYETMWTTIPSAIFQTLNCTIDTLVFLIREKPWELNASGGSDEDIVIDLRKSSYENFGWRYYVSFLPGYGHYNLDKMKSHGMSRDVSMGMVNVNYYDSNGSRYGGGSGDEEIDEDTSSMDLKDFLNAKPGNGYNHNGYTQNNDVSLHEDQELSLMDFLKLGPPNS